MVLSICGMCKGKRRVSQGGHLYVCPMCKGTGGQPLGKPPAADAAQRLGASRAAIYASGYVAKRKRR